MAKCPEILKTAIQETLATTAAPIDVWMQEGRPFGPGIPAGDGLGSYRTNRKAMDALARLADEILRNDNGLKRAVAKDTARMAAASTLGELLPEFDADPAKNWKKFRNRLLQRLNQGVVRLTHYFPVWIFTPEGVPAFDVGPVRFSSRGDWLKEIKRRRGKRSSWIGDVELAWRGYTLPHTLEKAKAISVARSVSGDQWVASVTVEGFEPEQSYRRALAATRAALDALRLVERAPANAGIRAARDHRPPLNVDRLLQFDGKDLAHGSAINRQGLRGTPEMAKSMIDDCLGLRRAAGTRIDIYLRPAPTVPTGCPNLSDRWVNALHWYGLGCAADADFQAILNFVVALDVLCGGLQENGICQLAERLLQHSELNPVLTDGTTLKALVNRLYGYRSEIAHGSILGLDEELQQDRAWAEWLTAIMLFAYVFKSDTYAASGGGDDRDAFFNALPTPTAPEAASA
jgi:hypothetical protein